MKLTYERLTELAEKHTVAYGGKFHSRQIRGLLKGIVDAINEQDGQASQGEEKDKSTKRISAPCPYHNPGEDCKLSGTDGCCYEMPCEVEIVMPYEK